MRNSHVTVTKYYNRFQPPLGLPRASFAHPRAIKTRTEGEGLELRLAFHYMRAMKRRHADSAGKQVYSRGKKIIMKQRCLHVTVILHVLFPHACKRARVSLSVQPLAIFPNYSHVYGAVISGVNRGYAYARSRLDPDSIHHWRWIEWIRIGSGLRGMRIECERD